MRSTHAFGAADMPQTANLRASASVDFPLPRGPMMQVRPRGILTLKPGRNPPLISIFSTSHIYSNAAARETGVVGHQHKESCPQHCIGSGVASLRYCAPKGARGPDHKRCDTWTLGG